MKKTVLDKSNPHFRARITVLRSQNGREMSFGFPSSGTRPSVVEFPDVSTIRSIGIYFAPGARLKSGQSFEADCTAIWNGDSVPAIPLGCRFRIWGMEPEAEGEVISIYRTSLQRGCNA
jgi:hypothetical protein